jgi:hypothetical protein
MTVVDTTVELERETASPFHCGVCKVASDDIFVFPDGAVICSACVRKWESDRSRQS